jgi:uncharacterized membrane protein YagU involved in acid resistance
MEESEIKTKSTKKDLSAIGFEVKVNYSPIWMFMDLSLLLLLLLLHFDFTIIFILEFAFAFNSSSSLFNDQKGWILF